MYVSEQELVSLFADLLPYKNPWNSSEFNTEFNYYRGRTDIVIASISKEVIAIEAKLTRWRVALQQAYKNLCFANRSYVLLPCEIARIANQYEDEFNRRGVGICCIIEGEIKVIRESAENIPIQPWLTEMAYEYALEVITNDEDPPI